MSEPTPDWVGRPYPDVGGGRSPARESDQWTQLPQDQIRGMSKRLNESIMQNVSVALTGSFVPTGQVGAAADQIWDWSGGVTETLTEHTEAIANLEEIAAAVNTTAAYVSDIDDMVTVPRFALSVPYANDTSRPKYADILVAENSGSTNFYQGVCPTIVPESQLGASTGHIYYTPIVVDRNGTIDKMRWIAGMDTSIFSIDYYEMALCVYNPATANIEKLWSSGNIKDAEASTTTMREVYISLGVGQACQPGQILFAAHQQTAPSFLQSSRRFAAVPQAGIARTVPLLDASCYVAPSYTQGIPSSIALSALTRENRFIPWSSVSVVAA